MSVSQLLRDAKDSPCSISEYLDWRTDKPLRPSSNIILQKEKIFQMKTEGYTMLIS